MVTKTVFAESSFCSGYTDYCCQSTDDKPTDASVNSLLLELDTKKFYYFNDGEWVELGTAPSGGGNEYPLE